MKYIMPFVLILLISVCAKAQDFDDNNYEYHLLDLLSIKNTDFEHIIKMYQYWEMEMPYYPNYIIIIEFKDNANGMKKENNTVYLQIRSTDVKIVRYDEFCGFFYTYEKRSSRRLVLVKYENSNSNSDKVMQLGNRILYNYKVSRTDLLELTGKTNLARFRKAKYSEIVKSNNAYTSCVFEYNIDKKTFKFLWKQFHLGRNGYK